MNTTRLMPSSADRAKPGFFTKTGWLTPYAMGCGYMETGVSGVNRITLWQEHGVYHVHAHGPDGRVFWDSFPTLTLARKRFMKGA